MATARRSRIGWLLGSVAVAFVGGLVAAVAWRCIPPDSTGAGNQDYRFREQEVQFMSGGNTLAGVLVLPAGPGPHPAVVFLNGSDGADRTGRGRWPSVWRHFARHGFASFSWDRPGVGGSTGDFEAQTFADRADEALAAVRYLQARSEIRADAVGLWGFSQGGIVAPLAGSRSRDVAFIIEVSGFQEAAWKQDLYRVEAELRADGFAEADISEAVAFASRRMDLLRHAGAFEELEEAQQRVWGRPWFEYVHYCDRKHFESGTRMVGFDPGPCWEQVCCPVLAIYGEKDTGCSAQEQVAVIRRGLQKSGNRDVTVKVFPRAGHLITVTQTGGRKEAARRRAVAGQHAAEPDFAPGYLETMSGWLKERFMRPP
jgi:pimeloyl-ACP methyl ester carboxylesterase